MANKTSNPQPQPETGTNEQEAATNVVPIATVPTAKTPSLIRAAKQDMNERSVNKVQTLQAIRDGLAEVVTLKDGEQLHEQEAEQKAA